MRMNEILELLECADVGRVLDLTSDRVRGLVLEGRLPLAAVTPRGVRLFRREDVEGYLVIVQRERAARSATKRARADLMTE